MVVTSGLRSEVRMRIMLVLLTGTVALYVAEAFLYYERQYLEPGFTQQLQQPRDAPW